MMTQKRYDRLLKRANKRYDYALKHWSESNQRPLSKAMKRLDKLKAIDRSRLPKNSLSVIGEARSYSGLLDIFTKVVLGLFIASFFFGGLTEDWIYNHSVYNETIIDEDSRYVEDYLDYNWDFKFNQLKKFRNVFSAERFGIVNTNYNLTNAFEFISDYYDRGYITYTGENFGDKKDIFNANCLWELTPTGRTSDFSTDIMSLLNTRLIYRATVERPYYLVNLYYVHDGTVKQASFYETILSKQTDYDKLTSNWFITFLSIIFEKPAIIVYNFGYDLKVFFELLMKW